VRVASLDHLVLTVRDVAATIRFYEQLGFRAESFLGERRALRFGAQRLHLHEAGAELEPRATAAAPGTADLCFLVETPIDDVLAELKRAGIPVVEGPAEKAGAAGKLHSVYIRDPDGNLVELSNVL
jgi:catechol 2,3-dioxygenase-like lactoylglutathione lyase family enzyme